MYKFYLQYVVFVMLVYVSTYISHSIFLTQDDLFYGQKKGGDRKSGHQYYNSSCSDRTCMMNNILVGILLM